ncbi:MAG: hypothetical protein AB7O68_14585 [Pirellulales bacterium]
MSDFSADPPVLSPEDLPRFHFFDDDRAVRYYHASPRATQSFGHSRIVAAIKSVIADGSPLAPGIQVDRIHAEDYVDPLAILRFPADSTLYVHLESEWDQLLRNELS